jgi:polyhydroxyalkanoate synthesis repressor PhaR
MHKEPVARQAPKPAGRKPVLIKKYPNRRLYDTSSSSYVTLDDLCEMVKRGVDFTVLDARSEEDLTRQVLTQIIFEQESKGYHLLPVNFLRAIIGFYGGKMQHYLPAYLEASMENFTRNQDKMRDYVAKAMQYSPLAQLEEIGKQNMALFRQAFALFRPFEPPAPKESGEVSPKL